MVVFHSYVSLPEGIPFFWAPLWKPKGNLSQTSNCGRLIVDTALETSGAPVHELNRTLRLDGGHGCVHILWHHISLHTGLQKDTGIHSFTSRYPHYSPLSKCAGIEPSNLLILIHPWTFLPVNLLASFAHTTWNLLWHSTILYLIFTRHALQHLYLRFLPAS